MIRALSGLLSLVLAGLSACKTSPVDHAAELKVTNGEEITADAYSGVVMLLIDNDSLCTGVFVNDHQVLTAAHCLAQRRVAHLVQDRWMSTVIGFKTIAVSTRLQVHPGYQKRSDNAKDLGIVDFPRNTALGIERISKVRPAVGDRISFIGYGYSDIDRQMAFGEMRQKGTNRKRLGHNRILRIENDTLVFQGFLSTSEAEAAGETAGTQAGLAGGDSGGPVFNARRELIGITSAGNPKTSEMDTITAMDNLVVDLTSETARDFLKRLAP